MTPNQLKKRNIRIQATSKKSIPISGSRFRRGMSFVEQMAQSLDEYDDFFEFEQDILGLPAANELAAAAPNHEYFIQEHQASQEPEGVVLEEMDSVQIDISEIKEDLYSDEQDLETKLCKYIKPDGSRCKVHIKNADYCRAHLVKLNRENNLK